MRRTLNLLILLFVATAVSAQSSFTSTLKAKPKGDATIYGVVECDGKPLEGVVVSDGYSVVKTDKRGVYNITSQKRNGTVFISIPRGYEAVTEGSDVVPQFWAHLSAEPQTPERHDFTLKAVDNDRHIIVAVADIHIANHHNDLANFRDVFLPGLKADLEQYRKQGLPIYTLCLGDSTHELYWYDYLYEIKDFRQTLAQIGYPTQFFNTMGNHDNDGATPCGENTDFEATAKYRQAFGPTYYSFNIGKVHYIMLDDIHYINSPGGKKGKGLAGARNYTVDISTEQMAWLAKDLATIEDKSTPIVIGIHAPIYRYKNGMNGKINLAVPEERGKELTALLKPFSSVQLLSGHAHRNRATYGSDDASQPDIANIIEHNITSVAGSLWYSSGFGGPMLSSLGEPAGCKIFTVDNKEFEWYFKPSQFTAQEQFRCFDMNSVRDYFATNGEVRVFLDHFPARTDYAKWEKDNSVMVHVWDWASDWKISITENGKPLNVVRKKAENPQMIVGLEIPNTLWLAKFDEKNNKTKPHPHMFHAVASAPDSTIEVTVTDSFGRVYRQTMERPKPFSVHIE